MSRAESASTASHPGGDADVLADRRRLRSDRARQVADVLRRQVLQGSFAAGSLPAEASLAAEFGVSRNAVRDALDLLRDEGLVERVPGVGTMVAARKYPHGLDHLLGLAETLYEHGEITNEVRAAGLISAPPAVAASLGLDAGTQAVYVERLRHLNGVPLSLDLTYLAADVGLPLLDEDLVHHDIFVLLERRSGQRLGAAALTVEAVNADRHSAAVLGVPAGAALLMVERLAHLEGGRPVDLEYIRFRGDRLAMRGQLTRATPH